MARMMIYAWYDQDNVLEETKMGDHFVPLDCTLQQAEQHTIDYLRTQFPRRSRHFDSGRVLIKIWDISDIARKFNKFRKGSHVDDIVRESCLGFPGTQGREFHALKIEEVELAAPQNREILVQVKAASLCHSDLSSVNGNRPRQMPMVLGH